MNNKPKIYDCFMFFNELDLLEIRFNELYDVVDKFVLVEATLTHSGKPKPLHFGENKDRFSKFLDKVIHIIVDDFPDFGTWDESVIPSPDNQSPHWLRENFQRRAILRGLLDCKDDDIIISTDADEIPSAKAIKEYKDGVCCLEMELSYYYINCKATNQKYWYHAQIGTYGVIKHLDLCSLRYVSPNTYVSDTPIKYYHGLIKNAGWHCSYLGGVDAIQEKIQSYCHQELIQFSDKNHISKTVLEGEDLFGRDEYYHIEDIDSSYPYFVLNNLEYYKNKNLIFHKINKLKIYDCFMFFNELDLLELRFKELYDTVDKFVLVEGKLNHAGNPKPLYFEENKQRFAKFLDKVIHIIVDDFPEGIDPWTRENFQRSAQMRALINCHDNDIITVTDVDEIPRASVLKNYSAANGISCLSMQMSYYFMNCVAKDTQKNWNHAKIGPYGLLKKININLLRYSFPYINCVAPELTFYLDEVKDAGWHFSFLGGVDKMLSKIQSYCHQELNTEKYANKEHLISAISEGKDIFDRDISYEILPIDETYPKTVTDNLEYYKKIEYIAPIPNKPKVYDCFAFFNELDLLEIRLNELDPYVDYFVISEISVTHTNQSKPLYFKENSGRFAKYLHKIIHIIDNNYNKESNDPWTREHYQRDIMIRYLEENCNGNDIVIVSDIDEIPRGSTIKQFTKDKGLMYFEQPLYKFFLNTYAELPKAEKGVFSRITTLDYIKKNKLTITAVRYQPIEESQKIENGGWHFSWLSKGSGKNVLIKFLSFAHREVVDNWIADGLLRKDINTKNIVTSDYDFIEFSINHGIDPFTLNLIETKEIDNTFPEFIQNNINMLKENKYILEKKENEDTIAIVMPYYNDKDFLLNSVNSIIAQNYNKWELFIVDDGSTPGIKATEILKDIKDSRINIINKENGGPSSARNLALNTIRNTNRYKYIAYCDADDIWKHNHLYSQLEHLRKTDSDLVYCNADNIFPNGEKAIPFGIANPDEYPGLDFMIKEPFIYISSVFHKIECLSVGDFNEKLNSIEDWDMWIRIAKAGFKFSKNKELSITYIAKNNGMAGKRNPEIEKEFAKIHYENKDVTAYISTKNRYFTTLPLAISAIANQTHKVKHLVIFDDADEKERKDLRNESPYRELFPLLDSKGISWHVFFGEGKGQLINHQKILEWDQTAELIWRVDDDNIPEYNCLENLIKHMTTGVGAVGGLIHVPSSQIFNPKQCSSDIKDIFTKPNIQWSNETKTFDVDHLHNSFLFRKEAAKHGYCKELSSVAHREETIFTYEMKRNGWRILFTGDSLNWHIKNPTGGIRSYNDQSLWEKDEIIFKNKMKNWEINNKEIIVLDNGLGDHYMFKSILDDVKKKYKNNFKLAVHYFEVFQDCNVELISIDEARNILGNLDHYNIYGYAWKNNKNQHFIESYKEMLGIK